MVVCSFSPLPKARRLAAKFVNGVILCVWQRVVVPLIDRYSAASGNAYKCT